MNLNFIRIINCTTNKKNLKNIKFKLVSALGLKTVFKTHF